MIVANFVYSMLLLLVLVHRKNGGMSLANITKLDARDTVQ